MPLIHVYPSDGLKTRHPATKQLLTEEGLTVDPSADQFFFQRRLECSDVTLKAPSSSTNKAAPTSQAASGGSSE